MLEELGVWPKAGVIDNNNKPSTPDSAAEAGGSTVAMTFMRQFPTVA